MFLFPYECIKKDSDIILYGAGTAGADFLRQINRTEYCNVLFALDRNNQNRKSFPIPVYSPEVMQSVEKNRYSAILISIQDKKHALDAKGTLIQYGVPVEKILFASIDLPEIFPETEYIDKDRGAGLNVAFISYGGIGDTLIASNLVKVFHQLAQGDVGIDFFCKNPGIVDGLPFIDHVYPFSQYSDSRDYDVSAVVCRNVHFRKINLNKVRETSGVLYDWCLNEIRLCREVANNIRDDFRLSTYAAIKGKNRVEQVNIDGILPLDRFTPTYMDWEVEKYTLLYKLELVGREYITISTGIEDSNTRKNPKLWPVNDYHQLITLIKKRYPNILIVSIGQNYDFGKIETADIDLVGKTDLQELKIILKHSILHIGVEGGLIHLKHFLNGKSVALFGPTSRAYFGYGNNINIQSEEVPGACVNGCEGISFNWMSYGCLLAQEPVCMKTLYPENVLRKISGYLDNKPVYRYSTEVRKVTNEMNQDIISLLLEMAKPYQEIALIKRKYDESVLPCAEVVKKITIFERDFFDKSINSVYGFIYNIPAPDERYDIVMNFTLPEEKFEELALGEMLRVTRDKGVLIVLRNGAELHLIKKERIVE